jgi:hypothetical protein
MLAPAKTENPPKNTPKKDKPIAPKKQSGKVTVARKGIIIVVAHRNSRCFDGSFRTVADLPAE